MSIDNTLVRRISNLAKIELSAQDVEMFSKQLGEIVNLMNQLNEVDTANVNPANFYNSNGHTNRTEDIVRDGNYSEKVLQNAPEAKEGFFTVKKVIE
ncbi:MAG: Asp-tRNA(Asn)/Glu-tRNA(Gln) amidotransferase subunit GatC [Paracoccaceae bacterium]